MSKRLVVVSYQQDSLPQNPTFQYIKGILKTQPKDIHLSIINAVSINHLAREVLGLACPIALLRPFPIEVFQHIPFYLDIECQTPHNIGMLFAREPLFIPPVALAVWYQAQECFELDEHTKFIVYGTGMGNILATYLSVIHGFNVEVKRSGEPPLFTDGNTMYVNMGRNAWNMEKYNIIDVTGNSKGIGKLTCECLWENLRRWYDGCNR